MSNAQPRRSSRSRSEQDYSLMHNQGLISHAVGCNMSNMISEINSISDELEKFPGNKVGGQPHPEGWDISKSVEEMQEILNKPISEDLSIDENWLKVKNFHETECDKLENKKTQAERYMYILKCRTNWLRGQRELKEMDEQVEEMIKRELEERGKHKGKEVTRSISKGRRQAKSDNNKIKVERWLENSVKDRHVNKRKCEGHHKGRKSDTGVHNKAKSSAVKANKSTGRGGNAKIIKGTGKGVIAELCMRNELKALTLNENISVNKTSGTSTLLEMGNPKEQGKGDKEDLGDSQEELLSTATGRSDRSRGSKMSTKTHRSRRSVASSQLKCEV